MEKYNKMSFSAGFLCLLALIAVVSVNAQETPVDAKDITIDRSTVPQAINRIFEFCADAIDRPALRNNIQSILARLSSEGVCSINICFALDGSSKIPTWKFEMQKLMADLIASVISAGDSNSFFSGVQYADTTTGIEPPTDRIRVFLSELGLVKQVDNQEGRNIAAGLGYCGFQLLNKPTGVLLMLGSGMANLGFDPGFVADKIRAPKGGSSLFAISTSGLTSDFDEIVGVGNRRNLFSVRECNDIGPVITDFMSKIC